MPVSGLVIRFSPDSAPPDTTLEALRRDPRIQVGEGSGHQLPLVVETVDSDESSSMWEWLNSLPGVVFIDLAFLHFEDAEELGANLARAEIRADKDLA